MSWLPLPRPLRQVCRDVDDELGFHLDEKVRAMFHDGIDPARAYDEALREFGDVSEVRAQLINIGMRPWRIGAGLCSLLLIAAVAGSVVAAYVSHDKLEQQIVAHSQLAEQLEITRLAAPAAQHVELAPAQAVRFVAVEGAVRYPRLWTIDRSRDLSLTQLLAKSGGLTSDASGRVFILPRRDGAFEPQVVDYHAVLAQAQRDPMLPRSCRVVVETGAKPAFSAASEG